MSRPHWHVLGGLTEDGSIPGRRELRSIHETEEEATDQAERLAIWLADRQCGGVLAVQKYTPRVDPDAPPWVPRRHKPTTIYRIKPGKVRRTTYENGKPIGSQMVIP